MSDKNLLFEDILGNKVQFNVIDGNLTKDEGKLFDKLTKGKWTLIFCTSNVGNASIEMQELAGSYKFQTAFKRQTLVHENPSVVLLVACSILKLKQKRRIISLINKLA